jgi:hypothetical protein
LAYLISDANGIFRPEIIHPRRKIILITDFPQPRKGWYETGIPHGTMRL